jgi:hypothetical protein
MSQSIAAINLEKNIISIKKLWVTHIIKSNGVRIQNTFKSLTQCLRIAVTAIVVVLNHRNIK